MLSSKCKNNKTNLNLKKNLTITSLYTVYLCFTQRFMGVEWYFFCFRVITIFDCLIIQLVSELLILMKIILPNIIAATHKTFYVVFGQLLLNRAIILVEPMLWKVNRLLTSSLREQISVTLQLF